MKKIVWATDIHLDFIDGPGETRIREEFAAPIAASGCDGLFVSGDISIAQKLIRHLRALAETLPVPIYFVLGNHDFYDGDFSTVRKQVRSLCKEHDNLVYLTGAGVVKISDNVGLVGHDGWYDALYGAPGAPGFLMNDWLKIGDYRDNCPIVLGPVGPQPHIGSVISLSRKISFESADYMRKHATAAAKRHRTVVLITHVPPFPQAHRHNGKSGTPYAMPWYTSRLMGDAIIEVASDNPQTRFEVFCGHSHGQFDGQIADNVFCHVGGAEYGSPRGIGVIQID